MQPSFAVILFSIASACNGAERCDSVDAEREQVRAFADTYSELGRDDIALQLYEAAAEVDPSKALDLRISADTSGNAESAAAYEAIWADEGAAIQAALVARACSEFPMSSLAVTVAEAPSYSGDATTPMRLRASYADAVKRGMLVHELAHWLVPARFAKRIGLSVHQALNLILPRVWEDLWGPEFVQDQIAFESQLSENYRADWVWALALAPEERRAKWMAFLEVAGRPDCSS